MERISARQGLPPYKLSKVLSCIHTNLTEALSVRRLASEVHMSPFHFARMFKLAVGHPPHDYVTEMRMERAKLLLAATRLKLAEVAASVGYQTQAHFTGVFRRRVGLTPRVYRVSAMASALRSSALRAAGQRSSDSPMGVGDRQIDRVAQS